MKFARKKRSKKVALILPRNAPKLRYEKACSGHIRMQKYDAVPPLDVSRSRSNPWARPAALTGLRRLAGLAEEDTDIDYFVTHLMANGEAERTLCANIGAGC